MFSQELAGSGSIPVPADSTSSLSSTQRPCGRRRDDKRASAQSHLRGAYSAVLRFHPRQVPFFVPQTEHDPGCAGGSRATDPSLRDTGPLCQVWYCFHMGVFSLTGCRFSKNPFFRGSNPRERDRQYSAECKRLLDLDDISLITVQACVLLGATAAAEGKPAAESVYYAVACRIAQLLDLPNRSAASPIEKEVNIRSPSPSPLSEDR